MKTIEKRLTISGRVQGVGFRYFTSKEASRRNLDGWVKNLSDGRVEVFLSGEEKAVREMINRLNEGPAAAVVKDVAEVPVANANPPKGFSILRS